MSIKVYICYLPLVKIHLIFLEQGEKMTAHDPMQKEMAREKKEERKHDAEYEKHATKEHNAAQKQTAGAPGMGTGTQTYSTTTRHTGTGGI